MRELREILETFARLDARAALGTIIRTAGSSYRKPGARMLVTRDGVTVGTFGDRRGLEIATRGMPGSSTSGVPFSFIVGEAKITPASRCVRMS